EEGEEVIEEQSSGEALDAGLIAAAQRVEHYEIAGYGTVKHFAELLGEGEAAELLSRTLGEEKQTDEKLTELANEVNARAMEAAPSSETEEEGEEGVARPPPRAKRGKARSARA